MFALSGDPGLEGCTAVLSANTARQGRYTGLGRGSGIFLNTTEQIRLDFLSNYEKAETLPSLQLRVGGLPFLAGPAAVGGEQ